MGGVAAVGWRNAKSPVSGRAMCRWRSRPLRHFWRPACSEPGSAGAGGPGGLVLENRGRTDPRQARCHWEIGNAALDLLAVHSVTFFGAFGFDLPESAPLIIR